MSLIAFPYTIPAGTLLDSKTGKPTQDWYRFFLSLFNRTGGPDGILPQVSSALAAQGSTGATALVLGSDWNNVTAVTAGAGVAMPVMKPGNDIWVFNGGASSLNVYPFSGATIDQLGVDSPFVLTTNKIRCFQVWTLQQIHSYGN